MGNKKMPASVKKEVDMHFYMLYKFMEDFQKELTKEYEAIPKRKKKCSYEQFVVAIFTNLILK
jgi:hypothetical protein